MELPDAMFAMLYRVVRKQNMILLAEIARRENLPVQEVMRLYLPSRAALKAFINHHHHSGQTAA